MYAKSLSFNENMWESFFVYKIISYSRRKIQKFQHFGNSIHGGHMQQIIMQILTKVIFWNKYTVYIKLHPFNKSLTVYPKDFEYSLTLIAGLQICSAQSFRFHPRPICNIESQFLDS